VLAGHFAATAQQNLGGTKDMDSDIASALARSRVVAAAQPAANSGLSAAQRVYEHLRGRIISLDLPPNTLLSRADLAREYDVSQTPLREALQRLEAEGLVNIFPQSRTEVTRLVTAEIQEAHFLRIAIETEVLRRLALACNPAILNRLKTIVTMQEALAGNLAELPAFQELDELFHQTLLAGVGHERLHALLRARTGHLNRLRRLDLPGSGKIARILAGHGAIIAALEARDPEAAQAAIREHLSQTISRLEELRAQRPDYFS
jgi:GntR family transcriptional regulator, rspAB operon transcriptional repressor